VAVKTKGVDVVIPIVFPDILIRMPSPLTIALPFIGHAGVLFIKGANGRTEYYDYGRYQGDTGIVRWKPIADVRYGPDGHPTQDTLQKAVREVAKANGTKTAWGTYMLAPEKFNNMLAIAKHRDAQDKDPKRKPYHPFKFNCLHFAMQVVEAAGIPSPRVPLDDVNVWALPKPYMQDLLLPKFPDLKYVDAKLEIRYEPEEKKIVPTWAKPN
jgi:hypothetical protein